MNKFNKGIAPVVVIIIIVAIILILGGIGYYYHSTKTQQTVQLQEGNNNQEVLGNQPSVTVVSPNGGEVLKIGETYSIKWSSAGFKPGDEVSVSLREDLGNTTPPCFYSLARLDNEVSGQGSYDWKVLPEYNTKICNTKVDGKKFKIVVYIVSDNNSVTMPSDESDNFFSIVAP
jgi:hypothetical protein